jgi:ABC-type maltose transport system permease subunit
MHLYDTLGALVLPYVAFGRVVLSTLPVLALYISGRRHLVSGLTAGVSK